MDANERQIISDIFQRLQAAAGQPRDPEAERFIAEQIRSQPHAPYAMAQTIFIQEQAVAALTNQVEELQAELQRQRTQPQGGGGFLSGIFGGGRAARPEPSYADAPRPAGAMGRPGTSVPTTNSPWANAAGSPQQQPFGGMPGQMGAPANQAGPWGGQRAGGGGGFLAGAMTTAAGVAGGMLLANALGSAFGGNDKPAAAEPAAASEADASTAAQPEAQSASYEDESFDDGGDLGGDDWA